jgi:hypothetical protein
MEIKMYIIIGLVVFAVVFLTLKVLELKTDIEIYSKQIKSYIDETNTALRIKIQNDLSVCVNKIKILNNESIQQVRKINILNNQPIQKNSNYFTETDSDLLNDIKYLSDTKGTLSERENKDFINLNNPTEIIIGIVKENTTSEDITLQKLEDSNLSLHDSSHKILVKEMPHEEKINDNKEEQIIYSEEKNKAESESIVSSSIKSINSVRSRRKNQKQLETIENYNLITLQDMAKNYGIQTRNKLDGKWKNLSKSEIYNEIKNYLAQK